MPNCLRLLPLAGLIAAASAWPDAAAAQVTRCVRPDGVAVYTDRHCKELGAVERQPRHDQSVAGSRRAHPGGCAHNLQDLLYEMTTAIDGGDVNRLAGVYHWTGMSGSGGNAVMTRLGEVVQRPLVEIVPVMPTGPDGEDGVLYPQTTVRSTPVALRVEQTLANSSTPSRTVFGLHQYFGCWWIRG
jgi:hypothetical protein